jgi:hypothetical protein
MLSNAEAWSAEVCHIELLSSARYDEACREGVLDTGIYSEAWDARAWKERALLRSCDKRFS